MSNFKMVFLFFLFNLKKQVCNVYHEYIVLQPTNDAYSLEIFYYIFYLSKR